MKLKNIQTALTKSGPTILTIMGSVGVIVTSVLTAKSTVLAMDRLNYEHHDLTKTEILKRTWDCYIPPVLMGTATIFCIFGSNALNKNQQAAMVSAYSLINRQYTEYRDKLKEIYGEEAHNKILDAIAVKQARDVYMSAPGFVSSSQLAIDHRSEEEKRLFYDTLSKRYFESTLSQVIEAEYYFNRDYSLGADRTINDLYYYLGLEPIDGGDTIGWFWEDGTTWIDFNHHKTVLDDGLEVCVIETPLGPCDRTD